MLHFPKRFWRIERADMDIVKGSKEELTKRSSLALLYALQFNGSIFWSPGGGEHAFTASPS